MTLDATGRALLASARLRADEPPLGLDRRESICPTCHLAHWSPAIVPCSDCTA